MKNILKEKPTDKLRARQYESIKFVSEGGIKDMTILDIGCGYGWFELEIVKEKIKKVYGIEISAEDLKAARRIKDKKINFKIGHALKIPFKDNYFDIVVAWEVIEHIPKGTESEMFKEVSRVLKKNGKFYLSTPYNSFLSKYLDPAWWLIGHRHYDEKLLKNYGKKNGFEIVEAHKKGRIWSLILILNFYFSKWILRRGVIFNDFISRKEYQEYQKNNGFIQILIKYKKKKNYDYYI